MSSRFTKKSFVHLMTARDPTPWTRREQGNDVMRVLLIEPAKSPVTVCGEDLSVFEPLALEYVAAGVSSDHDVRILDQRLDKDVRRALDDFRPDIVGGVTAYTVHVRVAKALCEQIKTWRSTTLTIIGGHHATVAPGDFVSPFIDVIVAGEGVRAFRTIVERFERGQDFTGIPGVAFTRDQTLVMEVRPAAIELDALPFPDRALTAQYRREYFAEYMKPLASIRTSKGCPFPCWRRPIASSAACAPSIETTRRSRAQARDRFRTARSGLDRPNVPPNPGREKQPAGCDGPHHCCA